MGDGWFDGLFCCVCGGRVVAVLHCDELLAVLEFWFGRWWFGVTTNSLGLHARLVGLSAAQSVLTSQI